MSQNLEISSLLFTTWKFQHFAGDKVTRVSILVLICGLVWWEIRRNQKWCRRLNIFVTLFRIGKNKGDLIFKVKPLIYTVLFCIPYIDVLFYIIYIDSVKELIHQLFPKYWHLQWCENDACRILRPESLLEGIQWMMEGYKFLEFVEFVEVCP